MTLRQRLILFLFRRLRPLLGCVYLWLKSSLPADIQSLPSPVNSDPELKVIDNLADLDAEIAEIDKALAISDDEGRRRMAKIHFVLPGNFPADPYSPEYAAAQMETYYALSGRNSYQPEVNERSVLDLEWLKRWYIPMGRAVRRPSASS